MNENRYITTELPPTPPPGEKSERKWYRFAGMLLRALYSVLITILSSLGATVLLNPSLRDYVFGAIFR